MKQLFFIIVILLMCTPRLYSQAGQEKESSKKPPTEVKEKKPPLFGITFSGFVKTDIFFDSRQTVSLREGHFLLYPENEKLDADGKDINGKGSFNILSIQTRLAGTITGPDALGAKTTGYIEGEFFGNINSGINSFRLRHAWIKLTWPKVELLTGQTWHPMFVPECSPATVSFNTGAPFVVFSRNPQIKISRTFGKFKLSLTALSQVDFVSDGPDGASPKYLRNSILPESNLLLQYATKNEEKGTEFLIGASINYQMLTPRLATTVTLSNAYDTVINNVVFHKDAVTASYKTNTKSSGLAGNLFVKLKLRKITLKAGGEYGDNNNAYVMLGGFAVRSVTDSAKGFVNYANVRSFAVWGEFHTNGTKWQPGVFGGFTKNLGVGEDVTGPYFARGTNISYAYRISPRLVFNVQKFRIAGEVEYTVAAYGKTDKSGFVKDSKQVGNARLLLGFFYFF
jgi:hypothetical protein